MALWLHAGAVGAFLLCAILGVWKSGDRGFPRTCAVLCAGIGVAAVSTVIALSWIHLERPPFRSFYETWILLGWCLGLLSLAGFYVLRSGFALVMGALGSAGVLVWAALNPDLEAAFLPPALQSPWFVPHVGVYFVGYACLILAAFGAAGVLLRGGREPVLARLADRFALVAFVCLGAGLCMGALWADEAWGTWWGWDPKESWALVTWLGMAGYWHLPAFVRTGRTGMMILCVFTAIMGFTYLGLHLLPTSEQSLHVYAQT